MSDGLLPKFEAYIEDGAELYKLLVKLQGQQLAEVYVVDRLLDIGGQGILFTVQDREHPGSTLLLKMPRNDYHRPAARLSMEGIQDAYNAILWEAYVLSLFPGTILPEIYDFFFAEDVLLDPWWRSFLPEPAAHLVMELVAGHTLDEEISAWHSADDVDHARLESLACSIGIQLLELFLTLWQKGAGFLYTDVRPGNVMIAGQNDGSRPPWIRHRLLLEQAPLRPAANDVEIRLIDAGSVVPASGRPAGGYPCQPAYAPPEYMPGRDDRELPPWPNQKFVLYTLGKTLFQTVTARDARAGEDPDFAEPTLRHYSPSFVSLLRALIAQEGSFESFRADFETIRGN